jgi:Protein of unknown function (DUF3035)
MNRRPVQGNRPAVRRAMWAKIACAALALAFVTGCGDTRKVLGLDKQTPDEFKIINRAPLSLPPDYALRVPEPGAQQRGETSIPQRALSAMTGTPVNAVSNSAPPNAASAADPPDPGQTAFLKQIGADRIQPDIRATLERENSSLVAEDQNFLDSLMFWRKPEDRSPVVDAQRDTDDSAAQEGAPRRHLLIRLAARRGVLRAWGTRLGNQRSTREGARTPSIVVTGPDHPKARQSRLEESHASFATRSAAHLARSHGRRDRGPHLAQCSRAGLQS